MAGFMTANTVGTEQGLFQNVGDIEWDRIFAATWPA